MSEETNMAKEKEITVANTHVPDKMYGYGEVETGLSGL